MNEVIKNTRIIECTILLAIGDCKPTDQFCAMDYIETNSMHPYAHIINWSERVLELQPEKEKKNEKS